jgi:glutaconate CoA-transferase subunit A
LGSEQYDQVVWILKGASMSKVVPLNELGHLVEPGATVGLGGAWMSNHPMAAVRELIRVGVGDLHVVDALASIDMELLVAAGLVREATFAMVSLEAFGLAPHFRQAVQDGSLLINEISGVAFTVALEAGARSVPYLPMADLGRSQLPEMGPGYFRRVVCPFTDRQLLAVRAINPGVALIHVRRADADGNCQVDGPLASDPELARAAKRVIVTCEEVVGRELIEANPALTSIPGFLVEAVIEAPFGAHPTTHVPCYGFDAWAVIDYADACAEGAGLDYVERLRTESEQSYQERAVDAERRAVLGSLAHHAGPLSGVPA